MLRFRKEQLERLEGPARVALAQRILPYLQECHAAEILRVPDEELLDRIVAAIARARSHRIRREASIALFTGLAFHVGPRFDEQPSIRRVLDDPRRSGDASLAALAVETTAADWEEARSARFAAPAGGAFMFDFASWASYALPAAITLGVIACAAWFGPRLFGAAAPCAPSGPPPPTADPPVVPGRHYLTLEQVAATLHAPPAVKGAGTSVAIIDSGCYPHPYYTSRGFEIGALSVDTTEDGQRLARPPNPREDTTGHGTSMVANVLAVAPESRVTMVKSLFFNAALRAAIDHEPPFDVISISNCSSYEQTEDAEEARRSLQALVERARARNVVIVCCSGNAGRHTVLGSLPGVITVGGAYVDEDGGLRASDYANATSHGLNRLPDVCGVCGPMPLGQYIMLPTAPGSANDRSMSEHGDGTGPDDGWTLASGTSSATPQVAAIVALMRQANPRLNVDQIRDILRGTARPVLAGQSHDGVAASDRWCLLPDAAAAVEAARRA